MDWALATAAMGLPVFPLVPGGKQPAIGRWQELATTDPDRIRAAWKMRPSCNIGVAMGRGVLGLDIDVKKGKQGLESLKALGLSLDDFGFMTETPSEGIHAYLRTDVALSNSAGRLGDGLDIRTDGGYLVGPGSVLSNGSGDGAYKIYRQGEIVGAPLRLLQRLSSSANPVVRDGPTDLDDHQSVSAAIRYLQERAPVAAEGKGGDDQTYRVACAIKDLGVSEALAVDLLLEHWNGRCLPPWEPDHLRDKVSNAYQYGENRPGSASPASLLAGLEFKPVTDELRAPTGLAPIRHGDTWDRNVKWLFYEVLPQAGSLVLIGPPNSGKTFLLGETARCLATGKPFFGVEPDDIGGTIFLYAGSEGSSFLRRLAAMGEKEDLPITAFHIGNLSEKGEWEKVAQAIQDEAERMLFTFGVPLRMIVLETLAASGLIQDENNATQAGVAIGALGQIAERLGVLFATSHHPPKEGRGSRGSGAITGAVDYVVEIFREGRSNVRQVEMTKARDGEQRRIGSFSLLKTEIAKDGRGRPVTTMTVSMGAPAKLMISHRAPGHMDTFAKILDAEYGRAETALGYQVVRYKNVIDSLNIALQELIPDKSNRGRTRGKILEYANNIGLIEEKLIEGVHYIHRKDMDND